MRRIFAKFASRCSQCKGTIAVGESILWQAGAPAQHADCTMHAFVTRQVQRSEKLPEPAEPIWTLADHQPRRFAGR